VGRLWALKYHWRKMNSHSHGAGRGGREAGAKELDGAKTISLQAQVVGTG